MATSMAEWRATEPHHNRLFLPPRPSVQVALDQVKSDRINTREQVMSTTETIPTADADSNQHTTAPSLRSVADHEEQRGKPHADYEPLVETHDLDGDERGEEHQVLVRQQLLPDLPQPFHGKLHGCRNRPRNRKPPQ